MRGPGKSRVAEPERQQGVIRFEMPEDTLEPEHPARARATDRDRIVPGSDADAAPRAKNATWCELMKHGLARDVLACPCGARMKHVATIARLLRARGLPHLVEPIHPARAPPQADFGA